MYLILSPVLFQSVTSVGIGGKEKELVRNDSSVDEKSVIRSAPG